jgi:uncharacterized protein (DUF1800 family)
MIQDMDERSTIAWLHRRFGFGLRPGELDAAVGRGVEAEVARLLDPDANRVPAAVDPWDDALFSQDPNAPMRRRDMNIAAVDGWLERMRVTPRPLHERMAWVWHDHFATSLYGVPNPALLVTQIRTIQRMAMGSFEELVRAMTLDPGMVLWLDGDSSTGEEPNENYGRELLELFTVGIGNHDEDDVKAAARALTGYRVDRRTWKTVFVPRRHDDTPQSLLGKRVHDVDTVVDVVCSAPACATFVATMTIDRLLGPVASADSSLVRSIARTFSRSSLDIEAMVTAIVDVGLDRIGRYPMVEAPVPWYVRAERATGARLPATSRLVALQAAGQLPMAPPDVGGFPAGEVWYDAATVVGRITLATAIAAATPTASAARQAAARKDLGALATALGRPDGFATATQRALRTLDRDTQVLTLALCAPDQVVV